VLLADVTGVDLDARRLALGPVDGRVALAPLPYDTLIVAAGSSYSYFGHDEWSDTAPEVKSIESALTVRARILAAFERAEAQDDPDARRADLTFVVVGGGPTGVEMAGQIGELARDTLRREFRSIDPAGARILLVEATDRLLPAFPASLSRKAAAALEELGVTPVLGRAVVGVEPDAVTLSGAADDPGGATERVGARTVIWAAGVRASPLGGILATGAGAEVDRAGRVTVGADLTLPGRPEVVVLGDMVRVRAPDGTTETLPGVAPVAIQQGRYAARLVADRLAGRPTPPFRYRDKGNLATIGRGRAVADLPRVRISGAPAWLIWLVVHLWYLIGFENRLLVLLRWSFSFLTHGRGARLITREPAPEGVSRPR
jgi:NADH:quinone reductase (non-electrogenic)